MELEVVITGILGMIATIVSAWSSWFFTKKKYNAEVDSAKIENLSKVIDTLNAQIENLAQRQNVVLERNKQLEEEVVELRKQMFNMMSWVCMNLSCKKRKTGDIQDFVCCANDNK